MKKRITVGTAIALMLIAAVLIFEVTYVICTGKAQDRYSIGVKAEEESDFISRAAEKLSEVDAIYREQYIDELDDDVLIDCILKGYVAGTGDKHGAYYNADEYGQFANNYSGTTVGIGVNVIYDAAGSRIEITNVMADSPAEKAGVLAGDYIVAVGEEKKRVSEIGYDAAVAAVRGEPGTEAFIVIRRGEEETDFCITRAAVESESVFPHVCETDEKVGIIRITGFNEKTAGQFIKAYENLEKGGCESFVFDLRNNPGGALTAIADVLDYLLPEGPIIRIFDADGNLVDQLDSDEKCKNQPFAILVNGSTASAAELFTSAMRDYKKATVVGTLTYGKGTMQQTVPLGNGDAVHVTYRKYNPPFSDNYDGVGITPDITVEPNSAVLTTNVFKLADKDDNQLAAAIEALKK